MGIRIALLMSGLVSSQAFAGLISAGILKGMDGATRIAAWRWLFIIEGLITIIVATISFFVLPDYPATTKWLSEDERICAMCRLADDVGSDDLFQEAPGISKAVMMAVKDYRVWLFACLQMVRCFQTSFHKTPYGSLLIHNLSIYRQIQHVLVSATSFRP
jgi:MFS family permease